MSLQFAESRWILSHSIYLIQNHCSSSHVITCFVSTSSSMYYFISNVWKHRWVDAAFLTKYFCSTENWLYVICSRTVFTSCTTGIGWTLKFIIDALILLMNYIYMYVLYFYFSHSSLGIVAAFAATVLVVVVVIIYRSHLIEPTEESFIHLIWP